MNRVGRPRGGAQYVFWYAWLGPVLMFLITVPFTPVARVDAFPPFVSSTRMESNRVSRMTTTVYSDSPTLHVVATSPRKRTFVRSSRRTIRRFIFARDDDVVSKDHGDPSSPALVLSTSRVLRRTEWLSWWAQVILTTVSAVTLLFARSVLGNTSASVTSTGTVIGGFFWAGTGLVSSCLSILWTWGGARLARRWRRKRTDEITAASMLRRAISIGSVLNLVGMGLTLLGAGQIVGGLAIKVLTTQGTVLAVGNAAGQPTLQPLDILIVQANTNLLLSHYLSLAGLLYLVRSLDKLDPPSVPDKKK